MGRKSRLKKERKISSLITSQATEIYKNICETFAEIPDEEREWHFRDMVGNAIKEGIIQEESPDVSKEIVNMAIQAALLKFGREQGYIDK